jgi:WD repeat-containing protein 40A
LEDRHAASLTVDATKCAAAAKGENFHADSSPLNPFYTSQESWVIGQALKSKIPQLWRHKEVDTSGTNKVFSSVWISPTEILFGTKDTKLWLLDTQSLKKRLIPRIDPHDNVVSPHSPRQSTRDSNILSHLSSARRSPDNDNASSLPSPPLHEPLNLDQALAVVHSRSDASYLTGVHSISLNPSKTLVAVTSGTPWNNISVYTIPELRPFALLKGHLDIIFSAQWLSDYSLMSSGRDEQIIYWNLPKNGSTSILFIVSSSKVNLDKGRQRAIAVQPITRQPCTLSADGFVKLWDPENPYVHVSMVPLFHTQELVCLGADQARSSFLVGSQNHVSIVDPRARSVVHSFESQNEDMGVRCLLPCNDILFIGGGLGRLSLFDLRANKYLTWPGCPEAEDLPSQSFFEAGVGWLDRDITYRMYFNNVDIKNGICTVSLNSSGTQLFAGGGPVQLVLSGSYAGIWGI